MTSADGAVALILSTDSLDARPVRDEMPTSNFFFYADDLEKTCAELTARGVSFPAPPEKQPWGWWSMFVDSEGNRFALQVRD